MASPCDKCGKRVARVRFVGARWLGHDCGCAAERVLPTATNPYGDLTLQHVHDENGKPLRVTSARQLREAETRYNFSSVVANQDSKNFDTPPPSHQRHVGEFYKRKFASRG